ncbi:ras-related protein Rab-8B-like [Artemia franciscana]|uniref:ras-related protein Rab-8B-like n=1 Tax=Artemia franciscana TaxID=6661 RepID=UPI0032DBB5B1
MLEQAVCRDAACPVGPILVLLEWCDTAGMETHFSLPRAYYRGADGILLVYDVTSLVSFNNLEKWLHQIERHASSDAVIMLLGNKFDKVIEMGDKQQVHHFDEMDAHSVFRFSLESSPSIIWKRLLNTLSRS